MLYPQSAAFGGLLKKFSKCFYPKVIQAPQIFYYNYKGREA